MKNVSALTVVETSSEALIDTINCFALYSFIPVGVT